MQIWFAYNRYLQLYVRTYVIKIKFNQWSDATKLLTVFHIVYIGNMVRDDGGHVHANYHSIVDHRSNGLEEGGN